MPNCWPWRSAISPIIGVATEYPPVKCSRLPRWYWITRAYTRYPSLLLRPTRQTSCRRFNEQCSGCSVWVDPPTAGGSPLTPWCRRGTSPERIAPESLTLFLSEFVHGHILYCRRCPPQHPVKRTNRWACRPKPLMARRQSDVGATPQARPSAIIVCGLSPCAVAPPKGIGSPASLRAQLASGL
jgi:hypothetical protein